MTRQAKLVVGPSRLRTLAQSWAEYGLLGEVAWLDSDAEEGVDSPAAGLPPEAWQSVRAHVLRPGERAEHVRLMHYLSTLDGATSTLLLWIRRAGDDAAAGLRSAEGFLLQAFPGSLKRERIDLIEPVDLTDRRLPAAPQGWTQYLIATQDNPELANVDAGWTHTSDAVAVHTIAALAGVLGGASGIVGAEATPPPRFVQVFSRHVQGGRAALDEAREYVDTRLPSFSAGDVSPQQFGVPLKPSEEVDRCLDWLRQFRGGQLRYRRPPKAALSDLTADERVAGGYWGLAIRHLFGAPLTDRDRLQRRIVVFCADAEDELDAVRVEEGTRPGPEVWRDATRLLTGVVDGGTLPDDFVRASWQGQQLVLAPRFIEPDPMLRRADYDETLLDEVPQLQTSPPLPIARNAIDQAVSSLRNAPPLAVGIEARRGMVELVALDQRLRADQADSLAAVRLSEVEGASGEQASDDRQGPQDQPGRLADRLLRDVLRDAVEAWRDGARWQRLATADWGARVGRIGTWPRILGVIGAVIALTGVSIWANVREAVNVALVQAGAEPIPAALGFAVALGGGLAVVVAAVGMLASRIRKCLADLRLELRLRERLRDDAETAYREGQRLDHALRIYSMWWWIFSELYGRRAPAEPEAAPDQPRVPASLQIAVPHVHANYSPVMIAKAATDVGWRGKAVSDLAATSLAKYRDADYSKPDDALYEDRGLSEGALHRLGRDLETGLIWSEWREREVTRISHRIRDELVVAEARVDHPTGQTVEEFLGEVLREPDVIPGVNQVDTGTFAPIVESLISMTDNMHGLEYEGSAAKIEGTWPIGTAAVHVLLTPIPIDRAVRSVAQGEAKSDSGFDPDAY